MAWKALCRREFEFFNAGRVWEVAAAQRTLRGIAAAAKLRRFNRFHIRFAPERRNQFVPEQNCVLYVVHNNVFARCVHSVVPSREIQAGEAETLAELENVGVWVSLPFGDTVAIKSGQRGVNECAVVMEVFDAAVAVRHGVVTGRIKLDSVADIAEEPRPSPLRAATTDFFVGEQRNFDLRKRFEQFETDENASKAIAADADLLFCARERIGKSAENAVGFDDALGLLLMNRIDMGADEGELLAALMQATLADIDVAEFVGTETDILIRAIVAQKSDHVSYVSIDGGDG